MPWLYSERFCIRKIIIIVNNNENKRTKTSETKEFCINLKFIIFEELLEI